MHRTHYHYMSRYVRPAVSPPLHHIVLVVEQPRLRVDGEVQEVVDLLLGEALASRPPPSAARQFTTCSSLSKNKLPVFNLEDKRPPYFHGNCAVTWVNAFQKCREVSPARRTEPAHPAISTTIGGTQKVSDAVAFLPIGCSALIRAKYRLWRRQESFSS